MRLRHLIKLNPSKSETLKLSPTTVVTFAPMEALKDGVGGLDTSITKSIEEIGNGSYSFFADGDILLAKVTPCFENGKKAIAHGLANGIGFATSEVHVIRPNVLHLNRAYLLYLLCSENFRAEGIASMTGAGGLKRISEEAVRNFRLPIANIKSQEEVANFLDNEMVRIDLLISKRKKFLSLIEEKKIILANKALDGSILEIKNPGATGWFGVLPENWKTLRAKFLFKEAQGRSDTGDEELLTVSHITGVTRRSDKNVNMFMAESMEGYKLVSKGDVVINTMWAWMGAMGVSPYEGLISPSYGVYRPLKKIYEDEYLDLIIRSKLFIAEATRRSKGIHSSRLRLYPDAFLDIQFPVPDKDAQIKILAAYKNSTERENKLAVLSQKSIDKLIEFRSSLITTSVTGQMDIRQWKNKGKTEQCLDKIERGLSS